jgi:hypothetical protein
MNVSQCMKLPVTETQFDIRKIQWCYSLSGITASPTTSTSRHYRESSGPRSV